MSQDAGNESSLYVVGLAEQERIGIKNGRVSLRPDI